MAKKRAARKRSKPRETCMSYWPNLPAKVEINGRLYEALVLGVDENTSQFMVALGKSGRGAWVELESIHFDRTGLRADSSVNTGPECIMCGQPTPAPDGEVDEDSEAAS